MTDEHQQAVPMINVYSLGKYSFCPRAGVIAHESGRLEEDVEPELIPRLDYSLVFDVKLLNERLDAIKKQVVASAVGSLIVLVLALVAFWLHWGVIDLLLLFLGLVFLRKLYLHGMDLHEPKRRLKLYANAQVSRLGDPSAGPRTISWWGLCKDEHFTSSTPKDKSVCRDLGLAGKAARLGKHAEFVIPVILHHEDIEEAKSYQRVRLAAHAILIEANQVGAKVVWGIVLNPITMRGLAIPLGAQDRNYARQQLEEFRRCLQENNNGTDPPPPLRSRCTRCPHGRPRRYVRNQTETYSDGVRREPILNHHVTDKQSYHSPCGDRFAWVPPHQEAIDKGFRIVIT
jgi:hypothetical protein